MALSKKGGIPQVQNSVDHLVFVLILHESHDQKQSVAINHIYISVVEANLHLPLVSRWKVRNGFDQMPDVTGSGEQQIQILVVHGTFVVLELNDIYCGHVTPEVFARQAFLPIERWLPVLEYPCWFPLTIDRRVEFEGRRGRRVLR